ncbi:hypothetical protein [Amnibacterium kyonggiense]
MPAVRRLLAGLGALLAVAIVAGSVVAFLAFAVEPAGRPARPAPAASVIARSTDSPNAPAAFKDRSPARSCGRIEVEQGATVPADRIACLAATPAGDRELVVVSATIAGGPVVRYYRTGPDVDGVVIFEDGTAVRPGGRWRRIDCRSGRIDQLGACA